MEMPERTSPLGISSFLFSVFYFTFLGRDERRFTRLGRPRAHEPARDGPDQSGLLQRGLSMNTVTP
jgi:hypothetical protein